MNAVDINAEAAIFLAEIFGCQILPDRCQDCHALLVMVPAQQMPFCVVCVAKRIKTAGDRQCLLKCKLASKGILLEERREISAPPRPVADEERSYWLDGMPI